MQIRHLRAALSIALLLLCVHAAAVWLARAYPGTSYTVRLAVLLAVAKIAGDLLIAGNRRASQPTVFYQDFLVDWVRFGVLGAVGLVLHLVASRALGVPPSPGPIALGVYLVSRAVFRDS